MRTIVQLIGILLINCKFLTWILYIYCKFSMINTFLNLKWYDKAISICGRKNRKKYTVFCLFYFRSI